MLLIRVRSIAYYILLTICLIVYHKPSSAIDKEAPREIQLEQRGDPDALRDAHRRHLSPHPLQSTGYWAQAGEQLTIEVEYQKRAPNETKRPELWTVRIGKHCVSPTQKVKLNVGSNKVDIYYDSVIYFVAPRSQDSNGKPSDSQIIVKLLKGGREIPRFVLGQHTPEDWQTMLARLPDAPYAELVGKRMIVTMPLGIIRDEVGDDPSTVLTLWDEIVTLAEEQYGLAAANPFPHHATPFQYQFITKSDGHGYMSASNYWLGAESSGAADVVNAKRLREAGWTPWHELGHHYQLPEMTWEDQVEVTVDLTSLYVQRALGQPEPYARVRWRTVERYLAQPVRAYGSQDRFVRLAMFWQLDLAFGKDFYARLGRRYRSMPPLLAGTENKKQTFILEASRIAGYNLTPFFDKWGLKVSPATQHKLASMQLEHLDLPIWENRDYDIRHTYPLAKQGTAGPDNPVSTSPRSTKLTGQLLSMASNDHLRERHERYGQCLEVLDEGYSWFWRQGERTVGMRKCDRANLAQQWIYEDGKIKHPQHPNKCLGKSQWKSQAQLADQDRGYAALETCDGNNDQQWEFQKINQLNANVTDSRLAPREAFIIANSGAWNRTVDLKEKLALLQGNGTVVVEKDAGRMLEEAVKSGDQFISHYLWQWVGSQKTHASGSR